MWEWSFHVSLLLVKRITVHIEMCVIEAKDHNAIEIFSRLELYTLWAGRIRFDSRVGM